MDNLVIVQYFPIEFRVGKYARTWEDNKAFNEKFVEQVHIGDWKHHSIIMCLLDPEYKLRTERDIENECILSIKCLYKNYNIK
jgi:hypothetical protein